MADVFAHTGITHFQGAGSNASSRAASHLFFGDSTTPVSFIMVNTSQGSQRARLQVDATADGGLYGIGCSGGIGTYDMEFIDGPYQVCEDQTIPDSVATKYASLQNMSDRRITVVLYRDATKAPVCKFVGILANMATRINNTEGMVYLVVALNAIGSWR